ncbi:AAA family ATPase [Iodidimonas sp. SYSU 1G8]|uniref:Lon protease family protein n=1 Tax=Iodidimonas sp. SYSU 1G8 TaxID=3133967 RepID=UPI0031FE7BB0
MTDPKTAATLAPAPDHLPLPGDALCGRCDSSALGFETTAEITEANGVIGQQRAVEAIDFALGMDKPGYNLFAVGPRGTGKHRLVAGIVQDTARQRPADRDWAYVHNFEDERRPRALALPAGRGAGFDKAMDQLVRDMRAGLATAFGGEDYRNAVQSIQEHVERHQAEALDAMRAKAAEKNISLLSTPMGFGFAPLENGKVMEPEAFNQLPEDARKRIETDIAALQEAMREAMQQMPALLKDVRRKIEELNRETAEFAIGGLIRAVRERYADLADVAAYLDAVQADLKDNIDQFLKGQAPQESGEGKPPSPAPPDPDVFFRRYKVNLIVEHAEGATAPVVFEDEPTYERLIGRIEHRAEMGALVTDFSMIRAGALHRANGGYLILDARKVLMQPLAWEGLKRALRAGEIRIEAVFTAMGLPATNMLEPEGIPLSVKVLLMGEGNVYYPLQAYDPEFSGLFKVLADFDERVVRTDENILKMARLVAARARGDNLKPFHRQAVARLIDDMSREEEDSERLSANVEHLTDLMRESDYLAGKAGREVVMEEDVEAAIDARRRRVSRIAERMQAETVRQTVLVDTAGAMVGQINGLSVYSIGAAAFGKPARITARVWLGRGDVIDIERAVALGGPLHSKGVMILSGYLGAQYSQDMPLSLSATLVFEQSYGGVDGDSASSAELYALLSALADVPIFQHFAVTGSVNQRGQVQAIGGVNEKVEGFFDLCAARGLNGRQGVLIPTANVKHLMLHRRVIDAVRAGQFHIHAVSSIDQGIEILTGVAAGKADDTGAFPPGTINARVAARLHGFAEARQRFGAPPRWETDA